MFVMSFGKIYWLNIAEWTKCAYAPSLFAVLLRIYVYQKKKRATAKVTQTIVRVELNEMREKIPTGISI